MLHRSHNVLIFEIETRQKYAEVLAYSGMELHLMTSERTPDSQRNDSQEASSIIFPRSVRGWDLVIPHQGRYSLRAVLYKPSRRRGRDQMVKRTEYWRIKEILGA